mgnify:CR=1 FL=1
MTIEEAAEEIRGLLTEEELHARWTLVSCYHQVGTIVNSLEGEKSQIVHDLAERIDRSERSLWYACKFASLFPDIELLPEGKDISWNKVINRYLTAPSPVHEHIWRTMQVCSCGAKMEEL